MADIEKPDDATEEESEERSLAPTSLAETKSSGGGFFTILKPGQGYWTRMVTAGTLILLLALLAHWFSQQVLIQPVFSKLTEAWKYGIVAGLLLLAAFSLWRYLNKPHVVDFLIETEKEMAKVNWTARRELIGSTRVVIIFMFLIAAVLFLFDLDFGDAFHHLGILGTSPLPEKPDLIESGSELLFVRIVHCVFWIGQAVVFGLAGTAIWLAGRVRR